MKSLLVVLLSLAASGIHAAVFLSNGGTGFGGTVGGSGAKLEFLDDSSTITGTFTRGTANFSDALVIYIDAIGAGANITNTNQIGSSGTDLGRRAIAAGTYSLAMPSGFAADYAIALGANSSAYNFGGLWQLAADMDTAPFVTTVNLSPGSNVSSGTYSFSFSAASLGLSAGQSFQFVTAYINPSNTYLSNESFLNTYTATGADGSGNLGFAGGSFNGAGNVYTITPEPSRAILLLAGLLGCFLRRRR
ncbi:MAG: PEP-CTERM sorting domain-containing protein [Roseimicrobium sp.]